MALGARETSEILPERYTSRGEGSAWRGSAATMKTEEKRTSAATARASGKGIGREAERAASSEAGELVGGAQRHAGVEQRLLLHPHALGGGHLRPEGGGVSHAGIEHVEGADLGRQRAVVHGLAGRGAANSNCTSGNDWWRSGGYSWQASAACDDTR